MLLVASLAALLTSAAAPAFSPEARARAAEYLDRRSQEWLEHPPQARQNFNCAVSCHTTHLYLAARPALGASPVVEQVRARVEARLDAPGGFEAQTPFYGKPGMPIARRSLATEAVVNAASLALLDAGSGRPLRPATLRALDVMWALQGQDGAWDWLKFQLEPWESSDDFGAALAALAAGLSPPAHRAAHHEQVGRLASYLRLRAADAARPLRAHDALVLLWAARRMQGLLGAEAQQKLLERVLATQRPDGGFALAAWGVGKRAAADAPSDGYATGLAAVALCESLAAGAREAAARALSWLSRSQRPDGSWEGRSLNRDLPRNHGFMTDAATATASLALATCPR